MTTTTSADGTQIAYTRAGSGPALVLVDGAMCYRGSSPNDALAKELATHFTVYTYDRRGRGESGDTGPYTVEREVEDVAALIKEAGGEAFLFGISSGAALALEAVNQGLPVTKLALYEPPFVVDSSRPRVPADYATRLDQALKEGKRGKAVKMFMTEGVGLSGATVAMMRIMPFWAKLKRVAHTIPYDTALVIEHQAGEPLPAAWPEVKVPALAIDGGRSPDWMRNGVASLAKVLPSAEYRTLPDQTHIVKAPALAPVLKEFFLS
ncbi:hydrolase [Amycolatopsis mediterranei S699]|uniref:Hydrolase n=2 Tax=Amycolatopsis mediterranei TaxID=33910 RepID=A0A0H3DEN9_AMYMU|nr:alpha/beta hydrolase [Amycolatopsis mediterranei]ADJ49380.1 hydrolase [Amycolatopsis mediterranei U32]AEK46351.1 hydrolase [Amycolatopsis mediterranei S699]AFO81088.1 hydrolase [Amycolatopsis mediterranei S699]AGT88216.1 hydrolase [Amycolatopsis mediterranei RB]KDO09364.1 hydrolase [Amycolatopsis mediterranei]